MRRRVYSFAASALTVTACSALLPADGYFYVVGQLPASAAKCQLLLRSTARDSQILDVRSVDGAFRVGFTVAPVNAVYRLSIACEGVAGDVTTVRYGTETLAGEGVQLGSIPL
jgi:hypothetical protein